jgi:hypothetical protein
MMPKGVRTWTPERRRLLVRYASLGLDAERIASRLSEHGPPLTEHAVLAQLVALRLRVARPKTWTAEVDEQLRALWLRQPPLTLVQIRDALGVSLTIQAVSRHALELGLQPRHAHGGTPKGCAERSTFPGQSPVIAARKPQARHTSSPLEAPCPFYLGGGHTCGVIVNRRRNAHGLQPSQYCPAHAQAVLPLPRGALGTIATYAKGRKYG